MELQSEKVATRSRKEQLIDIDLRNLATEITNIPAGPAGAQGPIGPQGVAGPVGPAGLNWQGAWSAAGTYVVDDAVGYNGASWFCINPVGPSATTPDSDPTNWALLAAQGAQGPQGPQGIQGPIGPQGVAGPVGPAGLNWQGAWSPSAIYAIDDAVGYNGASWFCIDPVGPSATTPDLDPTNWALLAAQGAQGPQGPQGPAGGTAVYTSGLEIPDSTLPGALLSFDINSLATLVTNRNVSLPANAPSGKEIFVFGSSQVGNGWTNVRPSLQGSTILTNKSNQSTNAFQVFANDIVRFTSIGNDYWIAENIVSSPLRYNGFFPATSGNNIITVQSNNTTTPLSLATLNSSYPTTSFPVGTMVICTSITGGGLMYIRTSIATWISSPITAVV